MTIWISLGHSVTVQQCLRVLEIVQNIVRFVAQESRRDVVSLSVTCRLFHDAAQNVIWENLTTLKDLLKCFPKGVWSTSQYNSVSTFILENE